MALMQLVSHDVNGVTFADPAKPTSRTRFKTTSTDKTLDTRKTKNYVHELILNDENQIFDGSVTDVISIRVRISGSVESQTRIKALVTQLCTQLPTWVGDENVNLGFEPVTPPSSPATV